jgi:mutator protein MutT
MKRRPASIPKDSITPSLRSVDVSAALLFRNGKVLVTLRPAESHLGGLWEFPGGKRETGETFEQCLVRELREELGVDVEVQGLFEEITHDYADRSVHLKFYCCRLLTGEPQAIGCAAVKWVNQQELAHHDFPAADARILSKLRNYNFP